MSESQSQFPGDKTYLVKQRLHFVEIVGSLRDQFCDVSLVEDPPYGGWTHPWLFFDSLRNYLLLTCFDVLGQPNEFIDFLSWLKSTANEPERIAAIDSVGEACPPIDIAEIVDREFSKIYGVRNSFYRFLSEVLSWLRFRANEPERVSAIDLVGEEFGPIDTAEIVYREYSKIYGARNAFYRFLNEVLSPEKLGELMYSIKIRRIGVDNDSQVDEVTSEDKKKEFLYSIRNGYTHKAIDTGSPAAGVFPDWGKPLVIDGKETWGYVPIHWEIKGQGKIEYSVRKWPDVLIDMVRYGLDVEFE